jgi:hypothetical protein
VNRAWLIEQLAWVNQREGLDVSEYELLDHHRTQSYVELAERAHAHGRAESAREIADLYDVINQTRRLSNDAFARLRTQVLAALRVGDDGVTSLTDYVALLIAELDTLRNGTERK